MTSKTLINKHLIAIRVIRSYLTSRGQAPTVRELSKEMGFRSPRSGSMVINDLLAMGFLERRPSGELRIIENPDVPDSRAGIQTVEVPLVGTVPCGAPLLTEENIECTISISIRIARPGHRYFLLRATGDSMNLAGIDDGDLLLVRQQQTAEPGDRVVALVDGESTVKEFHWTESAVILKPRSTNPKHRAVVVETDMQVQGVVQHILRGDTLLN